MALRSGGRPVEFSFSDVCFVFQALLIFWFHACIGCEQNIDFVTESSNVAANIPLNYIL